MTIVVTSFMFFLLCFLGVGFLSATRRKNTTDDYLLASRSIRPWVMALSAVATNNSGFMFIGLIGADVQRRHLVSFVDGGLGAGRLRRMGASASRRRCASRSEQVGSVTIPRATRSRSRGWTGGGQDCGLDHSRISWNLCRRAADCGKQGATRSCSAGT